jgi:riboflavin kinase / FMN adenylyltransferase
MEFSSWGLEFFNQVPARFDARKTLVITLKHSGFLGLITLYMLVETELGEAGIQHDMVLTIGVFDGVHLGHKYLLSCLKEEARKLSALSGVITFKRHPIESLNPAAALPYLVSLDEKVRLLKAEGIDVVIPLTFNQELADLSAVDFIQLLKKYLKMQGLVIGPDFALGRHREGNVEFLTEAGKKYHFSVTVVSPLKLDGDIVSSTAIRQALADGDMAKVVKLAGRPYFLKGRITKGFGMGRRIGYPTANILLEPGWAIPADGVYATFTHISGHIYQSMTSIGLRPTFHGKNRTVETYILDFNGDLYDREVSIDIVEKLRDERKFDNIEELKNQISRDIQNGKVILKSQKHLIFSEHHD